jgi:hypothetical protein
MLAYTRPREILAITSSQPNPETLITCEVLAYPRVTLHLCTCGLRGDVAAVAVTLIGYDDLGLLPR